MVVQIMAPTICTVCGGKEFRDQEILWKELIDAWQLAPHEVQYINRQQGRVCTICGANLRSIALANAVRDAVGTSLILSDFAVSSEAKYFSVLEINEAGNLHTTLKKFPVHVFCAYPEMDMHNIPYPDRQFDLVIHSDTLEHIENPIHALSECRRVLKVGGSLCFTVPMIVERLSRDRAGLEKSYHGNAADRPEDYIVRTEFGADTWTYLMRSGFTKVSIYALEYPIAMAFAARA